MKDTIYRQDAIDAFGLSEKTRKYGGDHSGYDTMMLYEIQNTLESLPSAQPSSSCAHENDQDLQQTCNQLATDTISRQAAIEVINAVFPVDPMKSEYAQGIACGAALAKTYVEQLPSAQPERTCVNCGRTANNGGWYADGKTRCPIEEHYALPKDGYCHLWEKRNVTDDDYPERREE